MKTPMLFFLIAAFLTFSSRKNGETDRSSANNLYTPASYCNAMGVPNIDAYQSFHPSVPGEHSFSNFKLSVRKYFIPENSLDLDNTGVILYNLEDRGNKSIHKNTTYTRGIAFVSGSLGSLSLQFSYNSSDRNIDLKADVSDAYGTTDHLLDYSININPCTAEPIASLLATLRNTFRKNEC